eukprot:scaffold7.g3427.t1
MQLLRRRQQPPHEESVAGGVWVEAVPRTPSAEDLAARAVAHSVNFRDLGTAMDLLPRQATLSIFGQLPFRLQAKVAWTALRRQQPEPIVAGEGAARGVARTDTWRRAGAIADPDVIGYLKLYKILLERSKLRLRCAFRLFADPGNLPALIHCIHGKDRTGLVAMMLLMLCGADRQTVVRDYAQSEALLRESRERRELLGLDHYLTTDQVIAAAARVMEATLDHVDARYGGVAGYLSHIGLSRAEVAAIRENLAGSHEALVARQGEEDGENKQCALRAGPRAIGAQDAQLVAAWRFLTATQLESPEGSLFHPHMDLQQLLSLVMPILRPTGGGRPSVLARLLAASDPVPLVDAALLSRLLCVSLSEQLSPSFERAQHIASCALGSPTQAAAIAGQLQSLAAHAGRTGVAWRPPSLDDARVLCWTMQYRAARHAIVQDGAGPESAARMLAAAAGLLSLRPDQPGSHERLIGARELAHLAFPSSPVVRSAERDLGLPLAGGGPTPHLHGDLERARALGSDYWEAKLAQSLATDSLSNGRVERGGLTTPEEAQCLVAEADAALKRCKDVLPRSWFSAVLGQQGKIRAAVRAEAAGRPGGGQAALLQRFGGGRSGAPQLSAVCDCCGTFSLDIKLMVVVIKATEALTQSLVSGARGSTGLIIGFADGEECILLSAASCAADDFNATRGRLEALLPPPVAVVGIYTPGALETSKPWQHVALSADDGDATARVAACGGPAQRLPVQAVGGPAEQLLAARFVPVRLQADHVLEVSSDTPLRTAFDRLAEQLCGSAALYIAEVADRASSQAAAASQAGVASRGGGGSAAAAPRQQLVGGRGSAGELGGAWACPLELRAFQRLAPVGGTCSAPRAELQPASGSVQYSALHLDVLCYAPKQQPLAEVVERLVKPAARRQLAAMAAEAEDAAAAGRGPSPLRAMHFWPPGAAHHVTVVYPLPTPASDAEEAALAGRRAALHALLGLPPNRPLLRVAHAAALDGAPDSGAGSGRLADVHEGLPPSGVGGSVHLVHGSYDYYHYMQDGTNDNGWGCAYRSLQTIWSWYRRQALTTKPVPSHREIQKALVAASQRPPSFLGSRDWIGALELGCLVEALLHGGAEGAAYRIINVASGADIPSHARELAHHFDTQGAPVMIGGGVLAYTLLGVDFNERTGDCAFLILDPHYTGGEDLKKIRAGGWVAWRRLGDKSAGGSELFRADAFYNFMCPTPPNTC